MIPARSVEVANRHPRLRCRTRAVTGLVHTLDTHFRILPADRLHLLPAARRAAPAAASAVPAGELSLVFLTDSALADLHARFLDDPTTTDVITFEGDPALGTAGEICVSADTAATYARRHGRDFSAELTLYVVHGWLHLAGYDDLRPARKRVMRRAEARALRLLAQHRAAAPLFSLAPGTA